MLRKAGADLVGMSTAFEAIAAHHLGASVLGISLVTNLAAGVSPTPLDHEEVLAAGGGRGTLPCRAAGRSAVGAVTTRHEESEPVSAALAAEAAALDGRRSGPLTRAELAALVEAGDGAEVRARFQSPLSFGTAGLRGELGAGPARMNRLVVRATTAGVAQVGARSGFRGGPARDRRWTRRPPPLRRVRPRRRCGRSRVRGTGARLPPSAADTPDGLCRQAPRRGGRRHDHREPQPRGRQRIQGLHGRRRAGDTAGRRPHRRDGERLARKRPRIAFGSTTAAEAAAGRVRAHRRGCAPRRLSRRRLRPSRAVRSPASSGSCTRRCTASVGRSFPELLATGRFRAGLGRCRPRCA